MAPAMKAMKAKAGAALSKSGIAAALAAATEQKPAVVKSVLDSLADVATKEVKKSGDQRKDKYNHHHCETRTSQF